LHKKLFGQVWGNSGKNPSRSQKFACSYTYDEKAPPPPLPPFERADGEMRPPCLHYPVTLCILFYNLFTRCCRLQCVTVMNINYLRSPKTEQFIPTKISSNALKQEVEHTWCYVRAVHNCNNTRLRECLVE